MPPGHSPLPFQSQTVSLNPIRTPITNSEALPHPPPLLSLPPTPLLPLPSLAARTATPSARRARISRPGTTTTRTTATTERTTAPSTRAPPSTARAPPPRRVLRYLPRLLACSLSPSPLPFSLSPSQVPTSSFSPARACSHHGLARPDTTRPGPADSLPVPIRGSTRARAPTTAPGPPAARTPPASSPTAPQVGGGYGRVRAWPGRLAGGRGDDVAR